MTMTGYGGGGYGESGYGGGEEEVEQSPVGGSPWDLPGRVEAEDFDDGGEGVSFHDTTEKADWAVDYRPYPVDVKESPDDDDMFSVGRFEGEEWLEYTVDVIPGTYNIHLRVGTVRDGRTLNVDLNGENLFTANVPNTGSWNEYETVTVIGVEVSEEQGGEGVLRISPSANGVDVGWLEFEMVGLSWAPDGFLYDIEYVDANVSVRKANRG
jgi:hypothetical protein